MTHAGDIIRKFKKGDIVKILPEFQDKGDDEFTWVVLNDESKGRVDVSAIDSPLTIKPIHVVRTEWIEHADPSAT